MYVRACTYTVRLFSSPMFILLAIGTVVALYDRSGSRARYRGRGTTWFTKGLSRLPGLNKAADDPYPGVLPEDRKALEEFGRRVKETNKEQDKINEDLESSALKEVRKLEVEIRDAVHSLLDDEENETKIEALKHLLSLYSDAVSVYRHMAYRSGRPNTSIYDIALGGKSEDELNRYTDIAFLRAMVDEYGKNFHPAYFLIRENDRDRYTKKFERILKPPRF